MNPLLIPPLLELGKELFKFGGSFRKEAITFGVMPPVFLSAYTTVQERCIESCTFTDALFSLSGQQWWGVAGSIVLLVLHLNAKRKDTGKE